MNANAEDRLVHPNHMVYQKMETLVQQMLDAEAGVPIKTVKSFLSKVMQCSKQTNMHMQLNQEATKHSLDPIPY